MKEKKDLLIKKIHFKLRSKMNKKRNNIYIKYKI